MSNHTKDALKMASLAIDSLETIQRLTQFGGGGATAALASISHLVGILQHGLEGKATPLDVYREIGALRARIGDNDAAADAALAAKFDTSEE